MPALDDILQQKTRLLEQKAKKRTISGTIRHEAAHLTRGKKELISFSCNDYFGLSFHPDVIAASQNATAQYGAGAGASRLISGNGPLNEELEAALARYKGTEAACVFGSGYLANLGTIPALVGAGDLIIADKFMHACMLDAARLSGATVLRFAHNNLEHCKMLLEANRSQHQHCLILTETVFSMDGDRAPLTELAAFAHAHDAWLMTDDAHGLGMIDSPSPYQGEGRMGVIQPLVDPHLNPPPAKGRKGIEIQMGTLSKGAGGYGGYVCGSQILIDYLKTSARSLIYSTALPPSCLAASIAALNIIATDTALTQKPLNNARYFTSLLDRPEAASAIVPVIIGDTKAALDASALLEDNGFFVAAIRSPTVPENAARLRFAFSAHHTQEQIKAVATLLKEKVLTCA